LWTRHTSLDRQHPFYPSPQQASSQILPKDKMNHDLVTATHAPTAWGGEVVEHQNSDQSTNSRQSRSSNAGIPSASTPLTEMGSHDETSPIQDFGKFETYDDDYAPTSISSDVLQDVYSTNDHTHSSDPGGTSRATPTTLGWTPDTSFPKLYKFWCKKNIEPYLELLPHFEVTSQTPQRVYLDKDE